MNFAYHCFMLKGFISKGFDGFGLDLYLPIINIMLSTANARAKLKNQKNDKNKFT